MGDIIDEANATADLFLAAALSKQQRGAKVAISGVPGMCLCCGADLPEDDRRWCNSECRDLWEQERSRK